MLNLLRQNIILPLLAAISLVAPGCSSSTAGLGSLPSAQSTEYRLAAGDKIRVVVQDLKEASADYTVDQTGSISMPFVKEVKIGDMTAREAQAAIEQAFVSQQILVRPRVSIQAIELRPFYVLGEVNKPGEYPYREGLTVFAAVSLAGGYTYRADTKAMVVTRTVDGRRVTGAADENTTVLPGDQIRVTEKWF